MESDDFVGWIQQAIVTGVTAKIVGTVLVGGAPFVPVAALLALKMVEAGKTGRGEEGKPSSRQISQCVAELRRANLDVRRVRGRLYVRIQPPTVEIELD